jgi:hypothetical protein
MGLFVASSNGLRNARQSAVSEASRP